MEGTKDNNDMERGDVRCSGISNPCPTEPFVSLFFFLLFSLILSALWESQSRQVDLALGVAKSYICPMHWMIDILKRIEPLSQELGQWGRF